MLTAMHGILPSIMSSMIFVRHIASSAHPWICVWCIPVWIMIYCNSRKQCHLFNAWIIAQNFFCGFALLAISAFASLRPPVLSGWRSDENEESRTNGYVSCRHDPLFDDTTSSKVQCVVFEYHRQHWINCHDVRLPLPPRSWVRGKPPFDLIPPLNFTSKPSERSGNLGFCNTPHLMNLNEGANACYIDRDGEFLLNCPVSSLVESSGPVICYLSGRITSLF